MVNLQPITDEKIKQKLNDYALSIQPDVLKNLDAKGLSENSIKLYDEMNIIYKQLCEKDICFSLTFVTKDEYKPFNFYRVCDVNNQERFQKSLFIMMDAMYHFISWGGFIKFLESYGILTINKKGEHKTCLEEMENK